MKGRRRNHAKGSVKTRPFIYTYTYGLTPWCRVLLEKVPRILWNLKVHYRIHKHSSPVPILSQLDPVHTLTSHFLKNHINITFPSTPGSPKWSLSLRFPHHKPVYARPLPHTCYMLLDFIIRTILGEEYRSLSSSLCSVPHSLVNSPNDAFLRTYPRR